MLALACFYQPTGSMETGEDDASTTMDIPTTSTTASLAVCGDGILDPEEMCDDGNKDNTDACLGTCVDARCGDQFVQQDVEFCDDGDGVNSDDYALQAHCNTVCSELGPHCGDGTCQVGHEHANTCAKDCAPACGNGEPEGPEECDDGVGGVPANSPSCDDDCSVAACGDGHVNDAVGESCDDGNDVDTDDCPKCQPAICGDGYVQSGVESCDDGNRVDEDSCGNTCQLPRRVFVTSTPYSGNLGGLSGADAKCQALADLADLGGTYKAWLSDDTVGPADRFDTGFTGVYRLVDGTVVARGWVGLTSGDLEHPVDMSESADGTTIDAVVWSNTDPSGEPLEEALCLLWTGAQPIETGSVGFSSAANSTWTDAMDVSNCSSGNHLYCFEDDT